MIALTQQEKYCFLRRHYSKHIVHIGCYPQICEIWPLDGGHFITADMRKTYIPLSCKKAAAHRSAQLPASGISPLIYRSVSLFLRILRRTSSTSIFSSEFKPNR